MKCLKNRISREYFLKHCGTDRETEKSLGVREKGVSSFSTRD